MNTEKYFDIVIRNYKQLTGHGDAVLAAAAEIYGANADTTSLNAVFRMDANWFTKGRFCRKTRGITHYSCTK